MDSRLGYGTRVDLYLPATSPEALSDTAEPTTLPRGNGELTLIVEDEPAVREIAAAFMRSFGYNVLAVGSAEEAMESIAHDEDIAILFSDIMLGSGLNGRELAIAARQRRPQLAVLLTSGYEGTEIAGASEFELLRKPYQREQLAAALHRSLKTIRAAKESR